MEAARIIQASHPPRTIFRPTMIDVDSSSRSFNELVSQVTSTRYLPRLGKLGIQETPRVQRDGFEGEMELCRVEQE